jgi:hypothetical protein
MKGEGEAEELEDGREDLLQGGVSGLERIYAVPSRTAERGFYGVFLHKHELGSPCPWQVAVVPDAAW